jgi:hypothetical protein
MKETLEEFIEREGYPEGQYHSIENTIKKIYTV